MQPQTIDPVDLKRQKDYEISSLTLKDSTKIIVNDSVNIDYIKAIADSSDKFIYSIFDTVYSIPLNTVSKIDIVKYKKNKTVTLLAIGFVTLCAAGIIYWLANMHFEIGH
jgi:hypothetical protein